MLHSVKGGRRSCGENRLDRSGAFKPSHCGATVGIGRGKIVDFGGCLGVGSVGWQVLAKEKAREFCLREPLVSMVLLRGPIVLVSLLVSVDNQN